MQGDFFGGNKRHQGVRILVCQAVEEKFMHDEDIFVDGQHEYLRAMTYSASLDFVSKICKRFKRADIIFGSEKTVSRQFWRYVGASKPPEHRAMEYQEDAARLGEEIVGFVRQDPSLFERVERGEIRFLVNRGQLSHDKTFIMTGGPAPDKVLQGSSNMSTSGFCSNVESGQLFIGSKVALESALTAFNKAVEHCAPISVSAFRETESEGVAAAVIRDIFSPSPDGGVVTFHEAKSQETPRLTVRILQAPDPKNRVMPDGHKAKQTQAGLVVTVAAATKATETLPAIIKTKREEGPLRVDVSRNGKEIRLGGECWSSSGNHVIHPKVAAHSARKMLAFLDNFSNFPQATKETPFDLWCALTWFFSTPFLKVMRNRAREIGQDVWSYPNHFILLGPSNLGKTTFSKVAMLNMYGHEHIVSRMGKKNERQWVRSEIGSFPYVMDDILGSDLKRETLYPDMVKSEQHTDLAPTFSSTNGDAVGVAPDVRKRAITLWLPFSPIPEDRRNGHLASDAKEAKGEVFRYWHARHSEKISGLSDEMASRGESLPDLFLEVSRSLSEDLKQLCPDFSDRKWLRGISSKDMKRLHLRPFTHELQRWISRNQNKADLVFHGGKSELIMDVRGDKRATDFFANMGPEAARIHTPTSDLAYDVDILEKDYGIIVRRGKTIMGMRKGEITIT